MIFLCACQPAPLEQFVRKLEARGSTAALLVVDADNGDTLFSHRPNARLLPASTMKLVSTYYALRVMGPDFRYRTRASWFGSIEDNIFNGNIVLRASGDPSLGSARFASDPLKTIVDALGTVNEWHGDVIVLDRKGEVLSRPGWSMDDIGSEYATPPTRFVWAENLDGKRAVVDPEMSFKAALKEALAARGIRWLPMRAQPSELHKEVVLESPTLRELAFATNKHSLNLYAERLFELVVGIEPALRKHGDAEVADGSGLSRYNLLTAQTLVGLLQEGAASPVAEAWLSGLPIAGIDGTLRRRARGGAARERVFAKTGTLMGQRALAGYYLGKDGKPRYFAFLHNNDPGTIAVSNRFLDELMLLLTGER